MTPEFKTYLETCKTSDEEETIEWTEEDIEKLVDLVNEHQNDWTIISTELGKPAEQCVIKFLEMPITENIMAKLSTYHDDNKHLVK
jgi:hypothetical protein